MFPPNVRAARFHNPLCKAAERWGHLCVLGTVLVFLTSQRLDNVQEAGAWLASWFYNRLFVLAELLAALWPCQTFGRKVTQVKFLVSCFARSLQRTRSNAEFLCESADKLACRRCCCSTDVLPEASRYLSRIEVTAFVWFWYLLLSRRRLVLANVVCVVTKAKWRTPRAYWESCVRVWPFRPWNTTKQTHRIACYFLTDLIDEQEVVPVHAIKEYRGSGGITPLILSLWIRWRWVGSLTPRPLYP